MAVSNFILHFLFPVRTEKAQREPQGNNLIWRLEGTWVWTWIWIVVMFCLFWYFNHLILMIHNHLFFFFFPFCYQLSFGIIRQLKFKSCIYTKKAFNSCPICCTDNLRQQLLMGEVHDYKTCWKSVVFHSTFLLLFTVMAVHMEQ